MTTIFYRDLSLWLKIAIVLSWITGILTVIAFLSGFMAGVSGG